MSFSTAGDHEIWLFLASPTRILLKKTVTPLHPRGSSISRAASIVSGPAKRATTVHIEMHFEIDPIRRIDLIKSKLLIHKLVRRLDQTMTTTNKSDTRASSTRCRVSNARRAYSFRRVLEFVRKSFAGSPTPGALGRCDVVARDQRRTRGGIASCDRATAT